MDKKYYLGLDIGTNSVGWALLNQDMKIVKKNRKSLWGVRMFEEAKDAKSRRSNRTNRRRLARRKFRLSLLNAIFEDEIKKVDDTFFERMEDSFFKQEDKRNGNYYNLFMDGGYTDKDYYKEFPTIFHLRKHLIESKKKEDIRFIYLALHNIIKYRGNFLIEGDDFNESDDSEIINILNSLNQMLSELRIQFEDYEDYLSDVKITKETYIELKSCLTINTSKYDKKKKLLEVFDVDKKSLVNECIIPLMVGSKCNLAKLKIMEDFGEKLELDSSKETFEEDVEDAMTKAYEISTLLEFLPNIKIFNDHFYLLKLLSGSKNISSAMVKKYDEHNEDLKELKCLIRAYAPTKYDECFRNYNDKVNNYVKYVGMNSVEGKDIQRFAHCSREEFYKYIQGILNDIKDGDAQDIKNDFIMKMENNEFMVKQRNDQNGSIPMQLQLKELKLILENQKEYYPFLIDKDSDNISNIDKIIAIFKYKVPYYVGPLNTKSEKSWVVRSDEKIYPWNIDSVVNYSASAEAFIQKMQNKCTYLKGDNDYCLPKNSIIFSKYNCLSYINKLEVNGAKITVDLKKKIFNDVFLKIESPTKKNLLDYLISNSGTKNVKITKNDIPEINCNMASYIKMKRIFGEVVDTNLDMVENIIRDITIFEDKKILETRLLNLYKFDEQTVKKLKDYNYKGYSSLCKNLISGLEIIDNGTGEVVGTLIDVMWNNNMNLQEVLYSEKYNFIDIINEYNLKNQPDMHEMTIEDYIEGNVYASPIMKRPLIQAYKIIDELEKIINHKIDGYFIECARTNDKKGAIQSRYKNLKDLYKSCDEIAQKYNIDLKELNKKLDDNEKNLRSDKIYLYFTQLGLSMYSLKPIDFDSLLSENITDIDHVYPRSLIKDDSLSNRVLCYKTDENSKKTDKFTFEVEGLINPAAYDFYKLLLDKQLISKEKYRRLTKKEITKEELSGFVNRQIVATNQAVKGLVDVLKAYKKVDPSCIVWSKASNISEFRNTYDIYKSRTANNFHHAHDAYLNVIVGKALNDYYTGHHFYYLKDYERLKAENITINPKQILDKNRSINGKVIWNKDEMLKQIKKDIFERFDILETVRTYNSNELLSQTSLVPAGSGALAAKSSDSRNDINKYGGIKQLKYSRYVIVKIYNKNGYEYRLEPIQRIYDDLDSSKALEKIHNYLELKYGEFVLVVDNIKTNVVVEDGSKQYYITGNTNGGVYIKNKFDRRFNREEVKLIHDIDKYNTFVKNGNKVESTSDSILLSPARSKENDEIIIKKDEVLNLIESIKAKYNKELYSYGIIKRIVESIDVNKLKDKQVVDLVMLASELLKLLKTNERATADLTMLGMVSNSGTLKISLGLNPGMKFISESITGYYRKVLFEVPK